MVGVVEKLIGAPGATITLLLGMPVVEDFAGAPGLVAVVLEPLRQGGDVRVEFTEMGSVVPNPQAVRTASGEEGRAGGIADGLLAVCVGEPHRGLRESIEIGRDGLGTVTG